MKKLIKRIIKKPFRIMKRSYPFQKFIIPRLLSDEIIASERQAEIKETRKIISDLCASGKSLIVGPWLSEIGFEILYWIPFLRWMSREHQVAPDRVTVVSRGGVQSWYGGIAGRYVDVLDFYSPDEYRQKNLEWIRRTGGQKQTEIAPFDKEIVAKLKGKVADLSDAVWLHPRFMYNLFKVYWRRQYPISFIEKQTLYEPFRSCADLKLDVDLPGEYVAVKFYFSPAFPDNDQNKEFACRFISSLSQKTKVVLLDTGLNVDDHEDVHMAGKEIVDIRPHIKPSNNLQVQSQVISNAKAFYGTYGGFSYLAPFLGVPSISFYSEKDRFLQVHLDLADRALRVLKHGSFEKISKKKNNFQPYKNPDFVVLHRDHLDYLTDVIN
jgi:hypothetical protein